MTPSPSIIAMNDEWAEAEVVDAEPAAPAPAQVDIDLAVVIAAARQYASVLRRKQHGVSRVSDTIEAACLRIES